MNNAENKKINWLRIIRPIALALVLVFLLSYATYSWMRRDWTPKIHQENVKIQAGSSLTFIYGDDNIDDIPVNDLLNMPEFVFKSVSNSTGESDDFFMLDYSTKGSFYDTFNIIDDLDVDEDMLGLYDNKYTAYGRKCGYIELKFHIASKDEDDTFDKNIYLDGSYIRGKLDANKELNDKAANAMRISVTVHGTGEENDPEKDDVTYIFAKEFLENGEPIKDADKKPILTRVHTGITDEYINGYGYAADGAPRYNTDVNPPTKTELIQNKYLPAEGVPLFKSMEVKNFVALSKSVYEDETEAALFVLKKNTTRAITVRVWLEGEDPDCVDAIAGSALDLLLKFSAQDIIPQAN